MEAPDPDCKVRTSGESPSWDYDAFLSYSTGADYRLAIKLEEFLEGFHEERGLRQHGLPALKVCTDGSDFSLPRRGKRLSAAEGKELEAIKEVIRPYLKRSAVLLVLWPGCGDASPFMDWELEEFLAQNERNGWERPVRLAVTRGDQPAAEPEKFFSELQRTSGLHWEIFYDLRGKHEDAGGWKKVRDFERERLRLGVDLATPATAQSQPRSVDDLYPGWKRAKDRHSAMTRSLWVAAAIFFAAVAAVAVWQYFGANAARAEATRRGYISLARALAAEAPRLQGQEKLDDIAALMARQAYLFNQRHGGDALAEVDAALRSVLATANFSVLYEQIGGAHNAIAWSEVGWQMVSGSPSRTSAWWEWSFRAGAPPSVVQRPQLSGDAVFAVAISGDGQTGIFATERHGLQRVTRNPLEAEPQTVLTNGGLVRSLALDSKGQWLGIGGNGGEFKLLNLGRPSPSVMEYPGAASVTAVAVSGEQRLAVWGTTEGVIRVVTWPDAQAGAQYTSNLPSLGSNVLVSALALSNDGRLAVSGWTLRRFSPLDSHQSHQDTAVAAPEQHPLRIIDLKSGATLQDLGPMDSWSDSMAFSPSGRFIAVGTLRGDLRVWDTTQTNAAGFVVKGHKGSVNALAWDDREQWVASMDMFGNLRVSMIGRQSESPSVKFADPVLAVAVDPTRMSVLCVGSAGQLNEWDPSTGQVAPIKASAWDTKAAAISRDGRHLALAAGHANPGQGVQVRLRGDGGFQSVAIPDAPAWVESLAFGPSGALAFGCEGEIRYWHPTVARTKRLESPGGWVRCLVISEDGHRMVSSSDDGSVRLWGTDGDNPVFQRTVTTVGSQIRALAINSGGEIAAALGNGSVCLFGVNGVKKLEFSDHRGRATALAFLGDDSVLASGGEDGTIRIYRLNTSQAPIVLRAESGGVNALAWRSKDRHLVAGYSSGRMTSWITDTSELAEAACRVARRDLATSEWRRYVGRDVPYERTCETASRSDPASSRR